MRLWHFAFAIFLVAIVMVLAQDDVGAVAMVVFIVGLGEVTFGTTALLALFQTFATLGEARDAAAHLEAIVATVVVLSIATILMSGWFFIGAWIVQAVVA
jgi:hypothetical protein